MMTLATIFKKNGYECIFLLHQNKVAENVLHTNHHTSILTYPSDISEDIIISSYFHEKAPPLLWIFDILSTEKSWVEAVQKHDVPVVCFDDLSGGPQRADLTINAIAGCWKNSPQGDRIIGGPHYAILPPQINTIKKETESKKTEQQIGISLGGSDTHGATLKIAQALQGTEFGKITFFLGPHFEHGEELREICAKLSCPFSIKQNVENLLKEMMEMNVAICNGGQTLFELCVLDVPTLALANEPHEEETICYFAKRHACINIGTIQQGLNTTFLRDILQELTTSSDKRDVLKKNTTKLVDGNGGFRCYTKCLELIAT